jgi:alpha-tubulin suppressor-like RCC1 family protein
MCLPNQIIASKGDNFFGQLGNHKRNTSIYMHKNPKTISQIFRDDPTTNMVVAGASCSFVLTSSGTIYSWGKNKNGILGLGHSKMTIFPTQISPSMHSNIPIARLDVNSDTAIALTTNGEVYTWGYKANFTPKSPNCITEGTFSTIDRPTLVSSILSPNPEHKIIDVSAGDRFFLALTKDRVNILTWGSSCCYNLSARSNQSIGITRVRCLRLGLGRFVTSMSAGAEHAIASLSVGQP